MFDSLTGDFIRKIPDGEWIYRSTTCTGSTEEVMKKANLKSIKEDINQRSEQVANYLFTGSTPMTVRCFSGTGYLVETIPDSE